MDLCSCGCARFSVKGKSVFIEHCAFSSRGGKGDGGHWMGWDVEDGRKQGEEKSSLCCLLLFRFYHVHENGHRLLHHFSRVSGVHRDDDL